MHQLLALIAVVAILYMLSTLPDWMKIGLTFCVIGGGALFVYGALHPM